MAKMLVVQVSGAGGSNGGIQAIFSNNAATSGIPGNDPGDPPFNNVVNGYMPLDATLIAATVRATIAPGAVARSNNSRFKKNTNTNVASFQYTDPATGQTVTVNATIPGADPASNATLANTRIYRTAWPSASGNNIATEYWAYAYECIAQPRLSFYVCSVAQPVLGGSTFNGSDSYGHIVGTGFTTAQTNLATFQAPWPLPGVIRVAACVYTSIATGTTVELALQKSSTLGSGNTDTTAIFTCPANSPTTNLAGFVNAVNIPVSAGEYLNWRIKRTAGAGTTGAFCVMFGFEAT